LKKGERENSQGPKTFEKNFKKGDFPGKKKTQGNSGSEILTDLRRGPASTTSVRGVGKVWDSSKKTRSLQAKETGDRNIIKKKENPGGLRPH